MTPEDGIRKAAEEIVEAVLRDGRGAVADRPDAVRAVAAILRPHWPAAAEREAAFAAIEALALKHRGLWIGPPEAIDDVNWQVTDSKQHFTAPTLAQAVAAASRKGA